MARYIKVNRDNIGLSPDAILFRGIKKTDDIGLYLMDYDANQLKEHEIKDLADLVQLENTSTSSWLNINGLHDEKFIQEILTGFDIEPLIISDTLHTHARPKIQEYDNCIYISVKMLQYEEEKDRISSENLVLIIKKNVLITFQEREGDVFEPVRDRLRKNKKRIRGSGPDYLAFALLDVVIDHYIYLISRIGEQIETLDEELISNFSNSALEEINKYKGEINYLRKSIQPCRELIITLVKLESELVDSEISIYLKELQNNMNLTTELLNSYRDILSDQLSIFHTNVSYKLNDILKFLTIFSVIFIPITFIAGIYGTNFDYIPELHFKYGYFAMWIAILITVSSMILYFKIKKWF